MLQIFKGIPLHVYVDTKRYSVVNLLICADDTEGMEENVAENDVPAEPPQPAPENPVYFDQQAPQMRFVFGLCVSV